jgi:hypothetical protein
MNRATLPALSFGVFDHLDHGGGSLRQQYSDRLEIAAACDAGGFRAYHVAEHHGTPHGLAASPNLFLSAVAQRTGKLRLGKRDVDVLLHQKSVGDNQSHHARENQQGQEGFSDHWPRMSRSR